MPPRTQTDPLKKMLKAEVKVKNVAPFQNVPNYMHESKVYEFVDHKY